jgi:uncharacterized integral membrane protein (TIGR00698 family)
LYPALDALFLALLFGIIFGTLFGEKESKRIAEKSLSITLPVGIMLYGANIKFVCPWHFPSHVIAITFLSMVLMSGTVLILSRKLGVGEKFSMLLACGSAICGASAIAVLSPIIKPKKEEFSAAIIIITIVGLTGAVLYPFLSYVLNIPPESYAILSGATLHQTGLVKIASLPFGEKIVQEALAVKGIRIAMIAVITLIVSFMYSEKKFYVPWYVVGFLVVALLSSFILDQGVIRLIQPLSTIAFSITLASIGFSVNIKDIQNMRLRPLIATYCGWILSLALFLIILKGVTT